MARTPSRRARPPEPQDDRWGTVEPVKAALTPYRVMATIVGVLLIILCLIGLPLHYLSPNGSQPSRSANISQYLGVAHGWLYMIFLVTAFVLSRKASWDLRFTIVTLVSGTIPILSFWAEHRATADVRSKLAASSPVGGGSAIGQAVGASRRLGQAGRTGRPWMGLAAERRRSGAGWAARPPRRAPRRAPPPPRPGAPPVDGVPDPSACVPTPLSSSAAAASSEPSRSACCGPCSRQASSRT